MSLTSPIFTVKVVLVLTPALEPTRDPLVYSSPRAALVGGIDCTLCVFANNFLLAISISVHVLVQS